MAKPFATGAMAVGLASLAATVVATPPPLLVWNVSASAPRGLYAVTPAGGIARGAMVIARLTERPRALAAARGYLPANVPLVKRAAAIAGDRVCAQARLILINGTPVAWRLPSDAAGRPLPAWQGCIRLGKGQAFLLMAEHPASFDGRYFGMTQASEIVGPARLIWPA